MTNTLYELALNQKIQNKLRKEIDEEYIKHGDSLTYEDIKKMSYLDKIFKGMSFKNKNCIKGRYKIQHNLIIKMPIKLVH